MKDPMQTNPAAARSARNSRRVQLSFGGIRVSLPCTTPYEAQLVSDHLQAATRRHGRVELRLGDRAWVVAAQGEACGEQCRSCHDIDQPVLFGSLLCAPCSARHLLRLDDGDRSAAA